jgi:uroporphyrinogen decarboxylase
MNPADLKSRYGDRIAFWGAVDVQDLMRTADPGTVTREVTRLVRALGDGGGYVLAPAHNIQDDVPAENVVAMVNSARANGA